MHKAVPYTPDDIYYGLVLTAKLNNLSVSLLDNLQCDLAIGSFKHAIESLRSRYSSNLHSYMSSKKIGVNNKNILSSVEREPSVQSACFHLENFNKTRPESKSYQAKAITLPLGFKRPQRIEIPDIDQFSTDEDSMTSIFDRYSATLLFNLGVTHQVMTYYSSESCILSLRENSSHFYRMSWSVIEESDPSHRWYSQLSISLLNNLGFLFCEQGDLDSARDCFRKLALIIIMDNKKLHIERLISNSRDIYSAAAA